MAPIISFAEITSTVVAMQSEISHSIRCQSCLWFSLTTQWKIIQVDTIPFRLVGRHDLDLPSDYYLIIISDSPNLSSTDKKKMQNIEVL